jgi:enoyl-CoA hydratase/carnithine racemase
MTPTKSQPFPHEAIEISLDDGVALVTLDRPERMNAWNAAMARDLTAAMRWADATDDVRCVVITGAGRAFCAGADLAGGADTFAENRNQDPAEVVTDVFPWDIRKPVIAAINGAAVGVGATYPMTADIRYAAEDAKIGFVFVRRGQLPELASHAVLPRLVGMSTAAELLFTGRIITGREAADLGLVSQAVPREDLLDLALGTAREIASQAAPLSVAASKRLLWTGITDDVPSMLRREAPIFGRIARHPDSLEGVASFLEKRDPRWAASVNDDFPEDLLG